MLHLLFIFDWSLSGAHPLARVGKILYLWFLEAEEIPDIQHGKIGGHGYDGTPRMGGASGDAEETVDSFPILSRDLKKVVSEKSPESNDCSSVERGFGYMQIVAIRGVVKVFEKGIDAVYQVVSLIELPEEP